MADIPVRKNCSVCGRWLHTATNFRPRGWTEDGSRPKYISSNCNICHRDYNRERHQPKITPEVIKQRRDQEFFVMNNKLDAGPFRMWLQQMVQSLGMANVTSAVGVSQRMVYTYIVGKYTKAGREYKVNYVQLATVHQYTAAMGHQWEELYPHIATMNRAVVRTRLWRKGISIKKLKRKRTLHTARARANREHHLPLPPSPAARPHRGDYQRKKKARRGRLDIAD